MKNVTFFACLIVLTLGASAQSVLFVSPVAIPPNAHQGQRANANGITALDHAATVQSAAAKPAPSGGPQGPPTAKTPPNAIQVPPVAKK
jgi:hypothetical protein